MYRLGIAITIIGTLLAFAGAILDQFSGWPGIAAFVLGLILGAIGLTLCAGPGWVDQY